VSAMGRTWQLLKQSFAVISADVEVLLFPVMSAVSAILVAATFFVPMYKIGALQAMHDGAAKWDDYAVLFAWYYVNFFVVIFFNSALVACANIRLSGGDPTVGDGLRMAAGRIHRIMAWTLVASTVGLLLQSLQNRRNKLIGSLFASLLGLSWTLITYLIVPVIIFEDRSMFNSISRSAELFKKNWGEQIAGGFGFGLLGLLLFLPGLALGALCWSFDRGVAVIVTVVYLLLLSAVMSAAKGVFTVALYRYATTGEAPLGFSAGLIDGSLGGRR
jgi:hypothetical protein